MQAKAVGGVKNLNAIENATEFNNALSENNVRQEKGKNPAYSQRYITNEQQRVSETLKKADDETRAKIFKQAPRLKLYFNNDGSVKGTQAQEKTAEQRSPSGSFSTAPMRASIKTDEKGRQYVQADRQVISGDDPNVWKSQITKYINDVIRQGQDLQIKTVEGDTLTITANTAGKAAFHNENLSKSKFKTKLDAEAHIDELAKTSIARKNIDGTKKIIPDRENKHAKYSVAKDGWNYRNAYFKDSNDNLYKLTLSVAIDGTVESVYNIGLIKKASTNGESRLEPQRAADASTPIIRKSEKKVNTLEEKNLEKVNRPASSASVKGKEGELRHAPASEVRSDIAVMLKDVMTISDGNIDYVVTDDLGDTNGYYDPDTGIMYLSNTAEIESLRSFVVGHEYTHSLEGTEEYTKLGNAILKQISEDAELSKKYNIEDYAMRYVLDAEKSGKKYSEEQYKYIAQTELVADFVGKEMLSNEATVKRIESRNKGIVSKLLQWVKDKISILKSKKGTERDTLKFLLKAEKMLSNAIGASVGGFDVAEIENDEEKEKTTRASIKKDFAKQIDAWDGKTVGFSFVVGRTSNVLKSIGVIDTQIRWDATKLKKIIVEHPDMTKVVIKAVPQVIEEPIIIMDSKTVSERLVLLGDVYDAKGRIVTVVLELNPAKRDSKGNITYLDIVKIASAYGKENIQGLINSSKIRYVDANKKRVDKWLKVNRLQLPLLSTTINSSTDSIFDKNEKVNTFEEKSLEKNVKIRKSLKITSEMTDIERYEILKDRSIENIPVAKDLTQEQIDSIGKINTWEDINKHFGSEKRALIKKIATEFNVFRAYFNKDIQLGFDFSKNAFEESYSKQRHNYILYAKMFSVFNDIIENAVGIEVHNGNAIGYKLDVTLKDVYVLTSAFKDGGEIVPVKLEVKEFIDKKNTLYVAIALESIKKDGVSEQGDTTSGVTQNSRPSNISILDLMRNVNPQDVNFTKYFPEEALTDEQRAELAKVDDKNTRKSLKVRDNPNLSQTTTVQGEKDKSLNGKNLRITIVFLGGYLSKIYSIKIQKKL